MVTSSHYRFEVHVDPSRDLVHYILEGFFDLAGVDALLAERATRMAALACPPNMHVTLADIRSLNLQSQTVLPAFQRLIEEPATQSRRLAVVSGVSLARMQVRRLTDRPEVQVFGGIDEAEAWLFAPGPAAVQSATATS